MSDSATPRRTSQRKNKGVPPSKFGSFDFSMHRTPPPIQETQNETPIDELTDTPSPPPSRSSNNDVDNLSRDFERKINEMRDEFKQQMQAMQGFMMEVRNELRQQPFANNSATTQTSAETNISAATQNTANLINLAAMPMSAEPRNSATMPMSAETRNSATTQLSAETNNSATTQLSAETNNTAATQNFAAIPMLVEPRNLPFMNMSAATQNSTNMQIAVNSATSSSVPFVNANNEFRSMQNKKIYPLPHFSGQPEEWQTFIEAYKSTTLEFQYSNLHNIMRIRDALSGRAKDTVEALLTNSANVTAILETLEQNYGRPEQLIKSQVEKVRTLAPVADGDLEALITFANKITNMSTFLENAKGSHHLSNPMLLSELVVKLPMCRQMQWAEKSLTLSDAPTIINFSEWLNGLRKIASAVADSLPSTSGNLTTAKKQQPTTAAAGVRRRVHVSIATKMCYVCENKCASVDQCRSFLKMSCDERWKNVKDAKICFSCLKKGHRAASCFAKKKCGLNGCYKLHHRLLHDTRNESVAQNSSSKEMPSNSSQSETNPGRNCHVNESRHINEDVLFQILPVKLYGDSTEITAYAFIDDGANTTIIDSELAHKLGISGKKDKLELQWLNNQTVCEPTEIIDVTISGVHEGAEKFIISKVFTSANLSLPHQSFCRGEYENTHIKNLPLVEYKNIQPQIIISLAHAFLTVPIEVPQTSINSGPIAVKTRLGWMAYGPNKHHDRSQQRHAFAIKRVSSDENIEKLLTSYFGMETFGVKPYNKATVSTEDARALDILKKSTKKVSDRFVAPLLWKENFSGFPESFDMAYRRLQSVERKMQRDPEYALQYREKIDDYIAKGYARRLNSIEKDCPSIKSLYLPHFAVSNPNKNGLRLVFDAAATVKNVSLNKALIAGPDLNQPLISILFKFRQAPIAVCGDIAEMFHQIGVQEDDQACLKFLWRGGDTSKPVEVYVMQRLIFGATCSPTIAQFVKNMNAKQFEKQHPRAVKGIVERHYMDDYVDCFSTEEEAAKVVKEVIDIHKNAGFILRNILSNSDYVKKQCGNAVSCAKAVKLEGDCDRVLGMNWVTKEDVFTFNLKLHRVPQQILNFEKTPTKRELLSLTMSVFDPFGFLGNFMISAKLLMQSTWKLGLHWDEELPENLSRLWRMWLQELPKVQKFEVPRCYMKPFETAEVELHLFADASEEALAVVAYFRTEFNGNVYLSFVCAKTSCAPTRYHTIPKLELQAATMAVRLKETIIKCHTIQIKDFYFWSDSSTTIRWIRGDHTKYKQYVANRVAEIVESSDVNEWHWCPGELNPADDGTRAKFPPQYVPNGRWISGPSFLLKSKSEWPDEAILHKSSDSCSDELRLKRTFLLVSKVSSFESLINRFSNYSRLKRTISWVLRYITNLQRKVKHEELIKGELSAEEEKKAEKLLSRYAQKTAFSNEYDVLEQQGTISKSSQLITLNPYMDSEGIIRASGRIQNAVFKSMESCRPIILPKQHKITRLIVNSYHRRFCHINRGVVINEIRRRFWIPSIREILKSVESKCQLCKIRRAKPFQPQMGVLPVDRVTAFVRPFSYTGVDFFGPLTVTIRRRQEKRWVALFTCLSIRAVHLELATDMSSDAFILCLRNFMNRRGVPIQIRSDNGTNFVGVAKELAGANDFLDHERVTAHLAPLGVKWIFNTPANPSEGGIWERLVQSVKKALYAMLKESAPRIDTLCCLLCEAENIVNSRPLTQLPVTPDEPEPITPNHFLLGCTNSTQTPAPYEPRLNCLRKQWRIVQNLKNGWWRQWLREYLPELTRRSKWCLPTKPLCSGSLVLICDPNAPRSQWRRGRVIELFEGNDGIVRSANVSTTTGVLKRPVSRLAVLDVEVPRNSESSPTVSAHGGGDVVEMATQP